MISINTNLNAQQASTQIGRANKAIESASEKLTTGLRINKSADDVSGAALANRLANNSAKTAQFIKNANDGINLIQASDNSVKQQQALVSRMQELAFKAENGTNTDADTKLIQKEFDQLAKEIVRNETGAEFNGKKILDGKLSASINVGSGDKNQIKVEIKPAGAARSAIVGDDGTVALSLSATGAAGKAGAATARTGDSWKTDVHDKLQSLAEYYNNTRADLGAAQNRLEFTTKNLEGTKQNIDRTLSATQDTDFAAETAELAKDKVLSKTSQAMLSQSTKSLEDVTQLLR